VGRPARRRRQGSTARYPARARPGGAPMSGLVYTGRWHLVRDVPPSAIVPVRISVGAARFVPGARRFPAIEELIPRGLLDVEDAREFTRRYRQRLRSRGSPESRPASTSCTGSSRADRSCCCASRPTVASATAATLLVGGRTKQGCSCPSEALPLCARSDTAAAGSALPRRRASHRDQVDAARRCATAHNRRRAQSYGAREGKHR